jgi:hypothetical protein
MLVSKSLFWQRHRCLKSNPSIRSIFMSGSYLLGYLYVALLCELLCLFCLGPEVHHHIAWASGAHTTWPRGEEKSAECETTVGGSIEADARRGEGIFLWRLHRCTLQAHLKVTFTQHYTRVYISSCFSRRSLSESSSQNLSLIPLACSDIKRPLLSEAVVIYKTYN